MFLNKFFSHPAFLNVADRLTRQRVMQNYTFYKDAQWWDRDKLVALQNTKLAELVRVAYAEVPLYRDLFDANNVSPDDVKSLEDIVKLPIITKDILKSGYPERCTRKTGWPVREYFTSGSTGRPFAMLVDNLSMSQARALMLLRANYGGWELGDSVLQTGVSPQRGLVKKIKDILFGVYYVSAFDLTDKTLDGCLELMVQNRIKFLMGFPGSIFALAERASANNVKCKLDGVITWGDNLYEHFRKKIEKQFECRVTDTYGCGEGIQVAAQCPDGYDGYHIFMPHVHVEIVDDEGIPVSRGESGNILLTRLDPGAMPLIRYKIGDVGRLSKMSVCPCGRGFDLLGELDGRDSDFIYTPKGNKLIVHFFTGIFEYYPEIKEFCIVQEKIDEIKVKFVPEDTFRNEILTKIKHEILEKGDSSLDIQFESVSKIENKRGKRRFVVQSQEFKEYLKCYKYKL